ncbi:MAG: hypothetical protein JWQ55_1102 [Rhodopila sp.]|jgi:hypothetical protein|nr:hypothetical protein [Rhodopila sp.]
MPNEQLLERLVSDLKPVRRRSVARDALVFAAVCVIELALFIGLGAMRPDMTAAMEAPSFWWKLGGLGLIAVVGGAVAIISLDPARSPRRGLRWLVAIVAICLAAGWIIDASREGFSALAARVDWPDGLLCVYKIVLLSVPPLVGLGLLMRRGAPTDTSGTALAVGVAAAAWGAFVFVFACPHDDPFYIALWYALGCGLVTILARFLLPRLTRW